MLSLSPELELPRCPHCAVTKPRIMFLCGDPMETVTHDQKNRRWWRLYFCVTCGGAILAGSTENQDGIVTEVYPTPSEIDDTIPDPARSYLSQACETIHAPSGSVMLAASAVDAMLKAKNYKEGTLNSRIDKAAKDHLITPEMAKWAHEVRLDANEQRHADEVVSLPSEADAKRSVAFARALAEFLFVLPARVKRGREQPPE
jgi:Domain of unknown function (DUF4145)